MGKVSKNHILSLVLTLALSAGCSHWQGASRDIAATQQNYDELMQDPAYNRAFQEIFSDENATTRYLDFFTRLTRMYYRNQALIYEFDQELDAGQDPMKSSLYQEIWVARDLKDHLEDKMAFHILKLRETEQTGSDEEARKARIILGSMARTLDQKEDHEKLPFIDLFTRIDSYNQVRPTNNKKSFSRHSMMDELISPFDDFMAGDFNWSDFYRENDDKIKNETLERVKSKKFHQAMEAAGDSSRSPNAVRVYPSTGDAGNMYGYRLPRGTWALTYDDGPRRDTTRKIMDELDNAGVKATFFWLAQNAGRYQDMIQKGLELEMDLANHSYSHANVPKLSRRGIEHEILESTDTLEALYGQKIKFFRLPYGSGHKNSTIRRMIAERQMIHAYWSVDSLDWQDKNPRTIFNRVKKQMERDGRGIILFHDIHSQTVDVTKMMMDYIREENRYGEKLRFMKMSDIVAELNSDSGVELPPAPAHSYRVRTDLNVRTGFSSAASRCAVLPAGTIVTIAESRDSYVRVSVHNPSYGLSRDLNACGGQTMVHASYLDKN